MLGVCLFVCLGGVSLGPEGSACLHLPSAGTTNIYHHAWLLAFILHRMWGSLDVTCSSKREQACLSTRTLGPSGGFASLNFHSCFCHQGDTSGDYRKILLKICGGND